ncbi:inner membrane protein YecN [Candidatus Phycosocius bacilliformis]|uniref:Inner membrane protein YecN n=1 Tax=Candidatus Phycosocius bacilliformis TaxID=1445552 RepID=A0A2P2E916_9PROT|nr:MAPEG family protein [Candidatus Phycosocius bacilliformis]GBF57566.1 inner membrane protein YecN [Candidatus Phycosocius bacilliformis]
MSAAPAFALYAGLNVAIILILIVQVIRLRRREKVSLGDGGSPALLRAIRAHANATEIAPIALIGLAALVMVQSPVWVIHVGGTCLTLGRALHGYGLSQQDGPSFGRMAGMILSLTALIWIGIFCLLAAI